MIKVNFYTYNNYVTDSLYQWDLNQDLVIHGLNLPTAPEIHFSNANMDRAIVRQATLESGVVTVGIPNSLLQDALTIKAYVGLYEGETFKVVEVIEIPIKAKARPYDYQISDSDEEIYSFRKLENMINEFNRYNAVIIRHSAIDTTINEGLVYYLALNEAEDSVYNNAPFTEGMIFTTCTNQNAVLDGQIYHQVAIDSITGATYTRTLEFADYETTPFTAFWVEANYSKSEIDNLLANAGGKFKTIGYSANSDYVVTSQNTALSVFQRAVNEANDGDTLIITTGIYGKTNEVLRIKKIGLSLVGVGDVHLNFTVTAVHESEMNYDTGESSGDTTDYTLYLNNLNLYAVIGEGTVGGGWGLFSHVYMSRCFVSNSAQFCGEARQCHINNCTVQGYYDANVSLYDCTMYNITDIMRMDFHRCEIYCNSSVSAGSDGAMTDCRVYGSASASIDTYGYLRATNCVFIGFTNLSLEYATNCVRILGETL